MAYIGNTVQNQGFAPAIDYFNGNGSAVTFTLSRPVASVAQMIVAVDNVIQNPSSSYTVSGNSITFSSAPLSGTNNIWVEYTSLITTYAAISQDPSVIGDITATGGFFSTGDFSNTFTDGTIVDYVTGNGRITVGPADGFTVYNGGTSARTALAVWDTSGNFTNTGNGTFSGTGALAIPVGTTAQRPTGATGMIRMNTTTGYPEWYSTSASAWVQINQGIPYSIEMLIVAGGGGGGIHSGGGGGSGGLLYYGAETPKTPNGAAVTINSGTAYSVVVGAGGAGSGGPYTSVVGNGFTGQNSVFGTYTALGGGGGGSANGSVGGQNGGAGGGGSRSNTAGSGTSGQGFAGGFPNTGGSPNYPGGGGGSSGNVGGNGNTGAGGNGGDGLQYSISGSATYYAGGGGGNLQNGSPQGTGGLGGGANGSSGDGIAGTANTGGGGGGAQYSSGVGGGAGGSGIVIIRYLGSQRGTGGTVTSSGGYTIHTFTTSVLQWL